MTSQLALCGRSSVEATIAAVSSTHPAAVIQLRSGCGERKNTSDGWLVWLSSMSTNHDSHRSKRSSSIRSSQPMRVYRVSTRPDSVADPARTSSMPTSASRRLNAP